MRLNTSSFQGSRLREAREARALSAVYLAGALGVSKSSVSQYEAGVQSPSAAVMAKMCDVLQLPSHFFTTPREPRRSPALFWRSQSAAVKQAKDSISARYRWFRDVVNTLMNYVEFPAPNMPDLKPPADPSAIRHEDIERYATETRRYWKLGDGPISNVVWLIENNGGIVVRNELGDERLDAFSDWERDGSWRCFIVLGTDKQSAVRSRFDAAHELGHVVLHRNVPEATRNQPAMHKLIETQADRFASAFLLPSATYPAEVYAPSLQSLLHLKPRWRVSVGGQIMRLHERGMLSDERKRQLWIQMSRQGWHRKEPLDNELAPEEPRLLKRAVDMVLDQGVTRREELELLTHYRPADIEKLLGVSEGYLDDPAEPLTLNWRIGPTQTG